MLSRDRAAALTLAFAAAAGPVFAQGDLRERINHALDQARPALLAHLRAADRSDVRPGELGLVVLAGVHDGLGLQDDAFAKALQRFARCNPQETYDLALRLMVCEAFASFPDRETVARKDAKELLTHRTRSGGFGYGPSPADWDLSNTQYGALGLRSARALGVRVERAVWQKLAETVGEQQDSYGGFEYARGEGAEAYASMTAAGIAVLAICRQELDDGGKAPKSLDAKIERGWQWFARKPTAIGSRDERWTYYFHYGLERAGILCDVGKVGNRDWYEAGATMLIGEQLAGGGWNSLMDGYPGEVLAAGRGALVPTSFAVLFLRRKFQKVVGAVTPRVVMLANLAADARPADVEACIAELVRRGKPAMPDVLQALRSEIEPQRRAAATALEAIAGERFGFDPVKDAEANRDAVHRAELWWLKNRG